MSQREVWEYAKLEEGAKFNPVSCTFRVKYLFTDDSRKLANNVKVVNRMAETNEKRLERDGLTEEANKVFQSMTDAGAVEEVSMQDFNSWEGPTHYSPIQHVVNEGSTWTPCRLVTNSFLLNRRHGAEPERYVGQGPQHARRHLEPAGEVQELRQGTGWGRVQGILQHRDWLLRKARQAGRVEMRQEDQWRTYAFVAVSFGDRPAAAWLQICVNMCLTIFQDIDPVAAEHVKQGNYVDDIISGGDDKEVKRFKGKEDDETRCDGTVSRIMMSGGLKLKALVVSREKDGLALEKLGGLVLGLGFSTQKDLLSVKCRANISKKKRGRATEPELTKEDLASLRTCSLTMRVCLGLCNSQYDPLRLPSPLIIRMKVGMKHLHRAKLDWS
jgi:hypothetical protein